jgi:phage tail tape-measure protein
MNITDEAMRTIVAKGIFDSMTAEMKEDLLLKAVQNIIEPQPAINSYGDKRPSALQQSFNFATAQMASKIVGEMFEADPTIKERIAVLVTEAIGKMFDGEDNQRRLTDAIAEGFRKSFGERY